MKIKKIKLFIGITICIIIPIVIIISIYSVKEENSFYYLELTKEEKLWIKENKSKKIVANTISNDNMYYYTNQGNSFGVFKDLGKYINELYGINIVTQSKLKSSSDMLWAVKTNTFNKSGFSLTEPYDYAELNVYTRQRIKSLKDLKDKPIAIQKSLEDVIRAYEDKLNFVIVDNIKDIKRLYEKEDIYGFIGRDLMLKHLDLSPENKIYSNNISNKFDVPLSVAVKDDKILSSLINKALNTMSREDIEKIKSKNRLSYIKCSIDFTEEEKLWLKSNKNILAKINYKFEPYYYENSIDKGILNEYIDKLEYLLDISFTDSDKIGYKNNKEKPKIYFGSIEEDENMNNLQLMNSYNRYKLYIYSNFEKVIDSINDLEGCKIGVVKSGDKKYIENNLLDYECIQYETYEEMIEALHKGKIKYFLGDNFIMSTYIKKDKTYKDIYQVGSINHIFYEYLGVNKEYPDLISIMNKVNDRVNSYPTNKFNERSIEGNNNIDYIPIIKIILALLGALIIGYIYILKLKKEVKLKNDFYHNLQDVLDKNERLILYLVETLEDVNTLNDSDTGNHIKRISKYCEAIAKAMNCDETFINEIVYFSSLHDIGKVGIPDEILKKSGKLTDDEMNKMKEHVSIGFDIIKKNDLGDIANNIILYHHEKYNGKGYLNGLKGIEIPLEARIVAIADVYDALRMERCYKPGFSHEKSMEIIIFEKGEHFDPDIVDVFVSINKEINDIYNFYK
ncbi:MAG: transporter substrate-binding domain-containing protein [Clostridia bacterium]